MTVERSKMLEMARETARDIVAWHGLDSYDEGRIVTAVLRFGELVARRCAEIAQNEGVRIGTRDEMYGRSDQKRQIAEAILREFGLKP